LPEAWRPSDLSSLLLLPIIASAVEALLLHAGADSRELFEWRSRLLLKAMGATTLLLSVIPIAMRVGALDLASVSGFQSHFPYLSFLSSPGLLLCGITAFGSIFLFVNESPVGGLEDLSLNHSMQYLTLFVQKMWTFSLICFWVYIFAGGNNGIVGYVLFPIKVGASLFLFTLLQASFPKIRTSDAGELTVRWLLRLCLIGCFLEAVWVGVRG
jgi:NADH:ubiquinone oxidoreductase subunit H